MSVVTTAISGYDLNYVWHNQAGQHKDYTVDAPDAEDKGRWWGPGLAPMGLYQGEEVERELYDAVYRQVNPLTGETIGRRPTG